MNLRRVLNLVVAMVVLAFALSVADTSLLATACLIQYAIFTMLEHDSERFRTLIDGYETELAFVKLALLVIAIVLLL